MPGCGCEHLDESLLADRQQKSALVALLAINASFFVIEFGAAWWAGSSALLADSGDMLADAIVYGVSLFAVARAARLRARAGLLNGVLQLLLGLGVVAQVAHILVAGHQPDGALMLAVAAVAAVANGAGAMLLLRHRHGDINMRSVWLCTRNDIVANVATVAAGSAVLAFQTPWPDVIVGGLLALLFIRTAWGIIGESLAALRAAPVQMNEL